MFMVFPPKQKILSGIIVCVFEKEEEEEEEDLW
jgi:hypothetical protein